MMQQPNPATNPAYDNPWRSATQDTQYMNGAMAALSPELYSKALYGTQVPKGHARQVDPIVTSAPIARRGYVNYGGRHAGLRVVVGQAFQPQYAETQARGRVVRSVPSENAMFTEGANSVFHNEG